MENQSPEDYISQLENELNVRSGQIGQMNSALQNNIGSMNENLIVFQLEVDELKDKIYHLLRGDILIPDENGNMIYSDSDDDSLKTLNDYGVKLIMNTLEFYLNRNTLLSHYKDERINKILFDLGNKLRKIIYINYEKMGMDTIEKQSRYPMIVLNILHSVESAYRRSLMGGERESLRSARVVTQTQPIGNGNNIMVNQKRRGFSLLNPRSWVK